MATGCSLVDLLAEGLQVGRPPYQRDAGRLARTGQLFRHLRTCNHDLWFQLQLSSKPSCTITTSTTGFARHSRKLSILTRNSTVKSRVSRTLSRSGLLQRRRMERRIKREDTRRTITVLCVTLNKKTHTVSALELHCALSTEHSECTQHSVHNQS